MKTSLCLALASLLLASPALAQNPPPGPGPYGPPPYGQGQPQYGPPQYGPGQPAGPPRYGAPPPQGYRAPEPPPPDKNGDEDSHDATFMDLLSVRLGSYRITGSDADTTTYGFLVTLDPEHVSTRDYLSLRSISFAAIGGGSDGLEGELMSESTVGWRGYLGDDHGPFARVGLGFQLMGNNKIYRSSFELPVVQLGYQLMTDDLVVEVGARGSLVLGGRYFIGDHAERRIDTEPAWGGYLSIIADPLRLHVGVTRIEARQTGPGTPIDTAQAHLCAVPVTGLLLCGHGALHRGDVELPGGAWSTSTARYLGFTIGLGAIDND